MQGRRKTEFPESPKQSLPKGRVMPRNPLPPYVQARIRRFSSMCALARFINQPYVSKMCPPVGSVG